MINANSIFISSGLVFLWGVILIVRNAFGPSSKAPAQPFAEASNLKQELVKSAALLAQRIQEIDHAKAEVAKVRGELERFQQQFNQARSQAEQQVRQAEKEKYESAIAGARQQAERLQVEIGELKRALEESQQQLVAARQQPQQEAGRKPEETEKLLAGKEEQIQSLIQELQQLREKLARIEREAEEAKKKPVQVQLAAPSDDIKNVKLELENLRQALEEKDAELVRLQQQSQEALKAREKTVAPAEFEKIRFDLIWLQDVIKEQRQAAQALKQRIEDNKHRLGFLNEKTKEGVEALMRFVKTKEFAEIQSAPTDEEPAQDKKRAKDAPQQGDTGLPKEIKPNTAENKQNLP